MPITIALAKLPSQLPAPKDQIPWWGTTAGEGPTFMPNPWDVAWFNGNALPGKWSVQGLPTLAVDKKKHQGVDGAAITVQGYVPGPIEIEGLIWTRDQWEFFQVFAPGIWRKPLKKAKLATLAVTIEHPGLALWGISKFVVIGVSPPTDGPIKQSKIIKIKGLEYVATDAVTRTKTASAPIVPLAAPLQPSKNSSLNKPPSETDTGVHGAKVDNRGGSD
jgi:hypothetical protein